MVGQEGARMPVDVSKTEGETYRVEATDVHGTKLVAKTQRTYKAGERDFDRYLILTVGGQTLKFSLDEGSQLFGGIDDLLYFEKQAKHRYDESVAAEKLRGEVADLKKQLAEKQSVTPSPFPGYVLTYS